MKSSFQIVKAFGIPVKIHWSFFLLFLLLALSNQARDGDLRYFGWSSLFLVTIFLCVVLHEFGHALTARHYGVQTKDIILSPIGGIARLNKLPEQPFQEFLVAAAGPLVNIAIAILLSPLIFFMFASEMESLIDFVFRGKPPSGNLYASEFFVPTIFLLNLSLAAFNMLPAFPMDGGRILRALLSVRQGRTKATWIAARIGQGFAVLLGLYGIWTFSILTVFIGVFVFITAAQEYKFVLFDHLLATKKVAAVMQPIFHRLLLADPMEKAAELLQKSGEKNFLVFSETDEVAGILIEPQIIKALRDKELAKPIEDFVYPGFLLLQPDISLREAFEKMQEKGMRIAPVEAEGEIIAVLNAQRIHEYIQLQQKINKGFPAN